MTEFTEALDWKLWNTAALVALVGDAIYPDAAERGPPKYLVYRRLTRGRMQTLAGSGGSAQPRYELQWWAPSRVEADAVGKAVVAAFDPTTFAAGYWGQRGTGPDGNPLGFWVGSVFVSDDEDLEAEPADAGDRSTCGGRVELSIMHDE